MGVVTGACMCLGAAGAALGQCASYTAAPGPATFIPGTTDIGLYADDNTANVTLPFSFSLYGNAFTSVNVDSNRFMDFTTAHPNGYYANACLPDVDAGLGPAIMAHWDDLRTDGGGGQGVFTGVVGAAPNRTFVIEWRAGYYSGCGGAADFEVLLYEGSSSFDVIYSDTGTCAGSSATVGVQDAGGTGGYTQYSCNTGGLTAGLSLHFTCVAFTEGACCNGSGGCTPTEPGACTGTFQGVGVACSPTNPCGGACCDTSASCTVSIASACPAGSVFLNGALCSPSPCPLGVCCANIGGACTLSLSPTCPTNSTFTPRELTLLALALRGADRRVLHELRRRMHPVLRRVLPHGQLRRRQLDVLALALLTDRHLLRHNHERVYGALRRILLDHGQS